ncbi:hypothetical protein DM02DRAFT_622926 [Periconia macrospinosa]|uniref:Protein BIG1 n=1 Tax=Periconia macrospinosa TaxID=97972 RepID=A0A2V1E9M2_9PLEO|nr:hypothetical protein DM02DRAFT_622926 [Periconia macrospinosa]
MVKLSTFLLLSLHALVVYAYTQDTKVHESHNSTTLDLKLGQPSINCYYAGTHSKVHHLVHKLSKKIIKKTGTSVTYEEKQLDKEKMRAVAKSTKEIGKKLGFTGLGQHLHSIGFIPLDSQFSDNKGVRMLEDLSHVVQSYLKWIPGASFEVKRTTDLDEESQKVIEEHRDIIHKTLDIDTPLVIPYTNKHGTLWCTAVDKNSKLEGRGNPGNPHLKPYPHKDVSYVAWGVLGSIGAVIAFVFLIMIFNPYK